MPLATWDGVSLPGDLIGVAVQTAPRGGSGSYVLVRASAGSAERRVVVGPDRLGAFILAHRDRRLVLLDAAAAFHVAADSLAARGEAAAAEAWRRLVDERRLHDLGMLDRLVRLAEAGEASGPLSLEAIAARRLGPGADRGVPPEVLLVRAYEALHATALRLMEGRGDVRPDAARRFGPLTESIQVCGAIALAEVSRLGMAVDADRLEAVRSDLRRRMDALAVGLAAQPGCGRLVLLGPDGRPARTATGTPRLERDALCGQLDRLARTALPGDAPRTSRGDVSRSADEWARVAPDDPFVRGWAEFERIGALHRASAALSGRLVRPRYEPLVRTGRCSCSGPNIQALPRAGGIREALVARPGSLLLIADYACAELRTLAWICEGRYGRSRLAEVLRAGGDPHVHTAAMLEGVGPEELAAMGAGPPEDRARHQELRRKAKAVNFGIPGGMGPDALAAYARSAYGVEMEADEAARLRERLIRDVCPELASYLADGGPRGVAATPTGRLRAGVGFAQALNTPFQGLAADGAKLGLWGLARAGYRVVAFVHDEFVVELAEAGVDHLREAKRIESILDRALEEVAPGVPSACEFALARRWSKQAKAAYGPDGRLIPWDDDAARVTPRSAARGPS